MEIQGYKIDRDTIAYLDDDDYAPDPQFADALMGALAIILREDYPDWQVDYCNTGGGVFCVTIALEGDARWYIGTSCGPWGASLSLPEDDAALNLEFMLCYTDTLEDLAGKVARLVAPPTLPV